MAKERKKNEDLFEETKMSFGEHIEELRVVFVRALIGIGVGVAIGLWAGPKVVEFLQVPLIKSIEKFQEKRAQDEFRKSHGYVPQYVKLAIEQDHMIPKELKVETARLAATIEAATSGTIIPQEDTLEGFFTSQLPIDKVQKFCRLLTEGETAPQQAVWNILHESDQAKIQEIVEQDEANSQQRDQVIDILNRQLGKQELYQSAAFLKMIKKDKELKAQRKAIEDTIKHDNTYPAEEKLFNPNELRSFTQLLLTNAFPGIFGAPVREMTTLQVWEPVIVRTQSLGTQEPFMVWLKAGFITGMAIASPWIFIQIWSFVAAGLYPHEKKYIYLYLPFSLILFVGGAAFAFYVVFNYVLDFLFQFNAQMGIDPDPRIGEYLGFVMFLPLGFGIAFQLPLVMLFLHRIGLLSIPMYLSKWRIAIVVICIISMVFTPTDPISMLLMAMPLIGLYFLGILLCKWMPAGRNPFAEGYDPS